MIPSDMRVAQASGLMGFRSTAHRYATASPGGPAGSALMSFFCVLRATKPVTTGRAFFGRTNFGNGWGLYYNSGFRAIAGNSTPASVVSPAGLTVEVGAIHVLFGTYNNGTISCFRDGTASSLSLGSGFSAFAGQTNVGGMVTTLATEFQIFESGHLDGVDLTNDITALTAQWREDLQQGRYLTWPRTPVANSDWYWSSRDAALGLITSNTWTDRYSSSEMTRTSALQSAVTPARF